MQFRLLQDHCLQRLINGVPQPVIVDKGAVITDADYYQFSPTPGMEGLDQQSADAVLAVCEKARETARTPGDFGTDGTIPGFGPEATLPGGDLYGLPQTDP